MQISAEADGARIKNLEGTLEAMRGMSGIKASNEEHRAKVPCV